MRAKKCDVLAEDEWDNLQLMQAVITWLQPSKKKKRETTMVLTSIRKLAVATRRRPMMFRARTTLRMMYAGPARFFEMRTDMVS